jgi:hypothetical protein
VADLERRLQGDDSITKNDLLMWRAVLLLMAKPTSNKARD